MKYADLVEEVLHRINEDYSEEDPEALGKLIRESILSGIKVAVMRENEACEEIIRNVVFSEGALTNPENQKLAMLLRTILEEVANTIAERRAQLSPSSELH